MLQGSLKDGHNILEETAVSFFGRKAAVKIEVHFLSERKFRTTIFRNQEKHSRRFK
jgi:hypothetical protein